MMRFKGLVTWLRKLTGRDGQRASGADLASSRAEAPLRAELFSATQMEEHGVFLAGFHRVDPLPANNRLLSRLSENEAIVGDTCESLIAAINSGRRITPAGEWLLDNNYLIEEHLQIARRDLPRGYSDKLRRLANGVSAGLPLIYDLALNVISHGDGRIELNSLQRFVAAYQSVRPLSIGELWAIPIMLRLALIENLRRVSTQIALDRCHRDLAASWAEAMGSVMVNDPKSLILIVADMARSKPPVTGPFVAELMQRLQHQIHSLALPVSWLEQRLSEEGVSIAQVVQSETRQQAADQVSISNSIGSLRLLLSTDWRDFVESLSAIDRILRDDPDQVYLRMDFATRDTYRHVVEDLAQRSNASEEDVALAALELARAGQLNLDSDQPAHATRSHVGHFLVGAGLPELRRSFGLRASFHALPLTAYLGIIAVLTALFSLPPLAALVGGTHSIGVSLVTGALAILVSSQLALVVVHWMSALLAAPRPLPRMDYSRGIPSEASTIIAVPTMITSVSSVDEQINALERRYLANRYDNLYFVLLTDFSDANTEHLPADSLILESACAGIESLNARHAASGKPIFLLLHRPRIWNAGERRWIGRERKRGKLGDLNAVLRGHGADRFSCIVGNIDAIQPVRYVITLDADTQLPHDVAQMLIATMQHPLNRAVFDVACGRIVQGYGVLQPRVGASLPIEGRSPYASLFGGDPGLDPYSRSVSDTYQDLFAEGSYTGKGIYDVDAFERALCDRLPDNRILSHDLLEGCHARSGLVSDVILFEEFPQRYDVDMKRRHRWIRGDWQIMPWLLPWVRNRSGKREHNSLTALSRWKILDNLRRSLVAPASFLLLALGWVALDSPIFWTLIVLQVTALPVIVDACLTIARKPPGASWRRHARYSLTTFGGRLLQALFSLACLPYESLLAIDAIVRTLWRTAISKRRLLEWTPSSVAAKAADGLKATLRRMLPALLMTVVLLIVIIVTAKPGVLWVATPFLVMWLLAPLIAWLSGRRAPSPQSTLDSAYEPLLRLTARRTWHYFETFVGEDSHWLPPDNFQTDPGAIIAARTSPTNIGLGLLALLAAHDFGYISLRRMLRQIEATFDTLERLERYRGHFLNWYDTNTLTPLAPRYVSTVDSGNLVGHLLTLHQGLIALKSYSPNGTTILQGLIDTARAITGVTDADQQGRIDHFVDVALESMHSGDGSIRYLQSTLGHLQQEALNLLEATTDADASLEWISALHTQCTEAIEDIQGFESGPDARLDDAQIFRLDQLIHRANELTVIDYTFLYNTERDLFHIGLHVDEHRLETGYYDLLASEARLGIFVAVARSQVPYTSWFSLGRLLSDSTGLPVLLSWSGSMFEYLMPNLVMPVYPQSLLESTCRGAVARQIAYGAEREVPWGISESGYHLTDAAQNFQYRAFGVPGLGLQRGLSQELVIAPYASALALLVDPNAAAKNLQRMQANGWHDEYGFIEAIDYTAARVPPGQSCSPVRSFMAHHQGMSLLAIGHVLHDHPMQKRFESDPEVRSALLLLQERVPRLARSTSNDPRLVDARTDADTNQIPLRIFNSPDAGAPAVQLLSNGRYHVMLTSAGGGYSRYRDLALSRWQEDPTCDASGSFCYLRDLGSGENWSTAYQPTLKSSAAYEAVFTEARVEFNQRSHDWETHTEIVVSPEDDIELRRTRITNRSGAVRSIEITTFEEIVLSSAISDLLHPAFSKLFVQTEIIRSRNAILASRRPRDANESTPWLFHQLIVHEGESNGVSFETDRARFLGRGRSVESPRAMDSDGVLSGSAGSVLDAIASIRHNITLLPGQFALVDWVCGIADNREACLQLVDRYQDRSLADRAIELAWTHSRVSLRQINISEADAQRYARLAGCMLYSHPSLRADAELIARNRRGQADLWPYAISGDLPILLVQINEIASLELARDAIQAHAYLRMKGLSTDLVIWISERSGYRQELRDALLDIIAASETASGLDKPGGIFVRAIENVPQEDRLLFLAVARVVLDDAVGNLDQHLRRLTTATSLPPLRSNIEREPSYALPELPAQPSSVLRLANGIGGFSENGREYVINRQSGETTPAPWVNVIANPQFGCVISESGGGYTWFGNAHEYRLTPWRNDPVSDLVGEAFYIRDEESGHFWSITSQPAAGMGDYKTRHGFGYSEFSHNERGIEGRQSIHVSPDAPIKFFTIRLRNVSGRKRLLSLTGYIEWILGDLAAKSSMHVVTEINTDTGALFARNSFHPDFGNWVSFFDVDDPTRTLTGDRHEFIGRNRNLSNPQAMSRTRLSGRVGAAMDPCAAIQIPFELADGQTREIVFRLGTASSTEEAVALVQRFRDPVSSRTTKESVHELWDTTLGTISIETPDESINLLCNGWLLYQVIASRLWARSGYYQSGGAIGFRDQLQDTMSLVHSAPELLRAQLLLCASRQFHEGDVQHWWHPPTGRGVRTRCSDDYLWLPLAICRYLNCIDDRSIFDEPCSFLEGRTLNDGEESYFDQPQISPESAPLYEHCKRAIEHGLRMGSHGLPLMGSGDWNDGMNNVGPQGRGESIWLGFFLHCVLTDFAPLARSHGDEAFAARCQEEAQRLHANLELHGWDGHWYRRAYFDDGTPLGSSVNEECRIDSIAQSWAVFSGASPRERTTQALDAVREHLVNDKAGLIQLLDPPFDRSALDPGYIRGYVPGVRENGGQYTHSAIWTVMAFVEAGRSDEAWELFDLINPLRHALTPEAVEIYKVEPYVSAADVYAVAPHTGRGGWTWYTGSAGWMYRSIIESLLGIRREGDVLVIDPHLRSGWSGFNFTYRFGQSRYHLQIRASSSSASVPAHRIALVDDDSEHELEIEVSRSTGGARGGEDIQIEQTP